jgi:hypothetical protein
LPSEANTNREKSRRQGSNLAEYYPALTVRQPWAELIITGRKSIEVRKWWTDYRGPLWIHAGRTEDVELGRKFGLGQLFNGGFIGRVILTAIVQFDGERWSRWRERHLCDGPMLQTAYGWVLKDPVRLKEPLPAKGALGLFWPDDSITRALQSRLPLPLER